MSLLKEKSVNAVVWNAVECFSVQSVMNMRYPTF